MEELNLVEERRTEPIWGAAVATAQALIFGAPKGRDGEFKPFRRDVISRDLKLMRQSVKRLKNLRVGMEDLRSELVRYRGKRFRVFSGSLYVAMSLSLVFFFKDNVGWFRAGVVGWFVGSPAGKIESLDGEDDEDDSFDIFTEMVSLHPIFATQEAC